MAGIAVDVEKKIMNKKGSCSDDGCSLLVLLCLVGLIVLRFMLMKEKKKNKKMKAVYKASDEEDSDDDNREADARFNDVLEDADLFGLFPLDSLLKEEKKKKKKKKKAGYKASEEDGGDDKTEADTGFNAVLEDLFGLSDEESEKMKKKRPVKDNISSSRGRGGVGIKEDDEGMTVKVEMPGLGKEDVKVSVVNNTLRIEGDDQKETDESENENGKKKNKNKWGMYLPDDEYKYEEMKTVMKNGVLTVVVPKKKVEERKDAINVAVVE